MPNSLIDAYRKQMADQGTPDDRDEYWVMQDLISAAHQNPDLLTKYPDFAQEYGQYRDINAPGLGGEAWQDVKGATEGVGSSLAGFGAFLGVPGAGRLAKSLETSAEENAPTIPTWEDVEPGRSGISKVLSKDTARYLIGKTADFLPSIAEIVGTTVAGGLIGSAAEPGVGTVAGAGEGLVEGILGRGVIRSAMKSLIDKGIAKYGTEEEIAAAIKAGDQTLADAVTTEAKAIAARNAGDAANLANFYALGTGGIYEQTGSRELAGTLGAASAVAGALPGISLPGQVLKKLFPGLSAEAAQSAAAKLIGDNAAQIVAKVGRFAGAEAAGTTGMVGMEAANIVAKNLNEGKDALDLDADDWKRLREATIGGALASGPFAALTLRETPPTPALTGRPPPAAPEEAAEPSPAAEIPETQPAMPLSVQITRKVALMTPDEARARFRQLNANPNRDRGEEIEYQQLKALAPSSAVMGVPAAETLGQTPEPETPVAPAAEEPGAAPATPIAATAPEPIPPAPPPAAQIEVPPPEAPKPTPAPQLPPGEAPTVPTFKEAGFESEEHLEREYAARHERDAFETKDEFLNRIYCMSTA